MPKELTRASLWLSVLLVGCVQSPSRTWHAVVPGSFGEHAKLDRNDLDFFDGKGLWLRMEAPCRWAEGHPAVVRFQLRNRGPSRLMKFPTSAGFGKPDEPEVHGFIVAYERICGGCERPCGYGARYVHEGGLIEGDLVVAQELEADVVGDVRVRISLVGVGLFGHCLGQGAFEGIVRVPDDAKIPACHADRLIQE